MGVTLVIYISCNQNQNECSLIQTSPYQVFTRSSPLCQCKSFCASANFPEPWSMRRQCCFDWSTAFRIMELLSIFRKGMSADQTPTLLFFPNQCCTKNRKEKKNETKQQQKKILCCTELLYCVYWGGIMYYAGVCVVLMQRWQRGAVDPCTIVGWTEVKQIHLCIFHLYIQTIMKPAVQRCKSVKCF